MTGERKVVALAVALLIGRDDTTERATAIAMHAAYRDGRPGPPCRQAPGRARNAATGRSIRSGIVRNNSQSHPVVRPPNDFGYSYEIRLNTRVWIVVAFRYYRSQKTDSPGRTRTVTPGGKGF